MFLLRPNHQIDRQKWDECIERSPEGLVYALSWYLDLVSPGWEALIDEQEGEYLTVVPLPTARKFGLSFLRQPLFCQQLGVFSVLEEVPLSFLGAVVNELCHHYRHIRDYSFNTANPDLPLLSLSGLSVWNQHTHFLSLLEPYERLYRQYSRDRKLNLRRAQKANLTVSESQDIRPLIDIFREDTAHKIYGGVAESSYDLLASLFAEFQKRDWARLLYTHQAGGEKEAGCLFVQYKGRITYLFNAATKTGRNRNGRSLMIDQIIRENAGKDRILDFESPSGMEAITYFYQGFGATPVRFQTIQYNNLPIYIRIFQETRKFFFQKMFLPASGNAKGGK
ncbi:hypothetical protein BH24BAC1_BH24BAC1_35860 [soil metagenome]